MEFSLSRGRLVRPVARREIVVLFICHAGSGFEPRLAVTACCHDYSDLAVVSRVSESVSMGQLEPVARRAARVLIIDERSRVLLFGYREPTTGDEFWATPGGGIESGESPA